ncbi:MAG: GNAT family N-acetyltransferase [Gammaproteobacteria bacterium]|nr:GNAT family N-acetyltransferase [Gammaproteobacteria bacterium]
MNITIKRPKTEKEFEDYYDLRWRILREPWNQPRGSEKDEFEDNSFHIMACDKNNNVVGIGRLHFNNKKEAQIRYMAVAPEYTNLGIGALILETLEEQAQQQGCKNIVLDAREKAVGFYIKNNYKLLNKSHLLFNSIQHFRLKKRITI